jgi:hypothetical protein
LDWELDSVHGGEIITRFKFSIWLVALALAVVCLPHPVMAADQHSQVGLAACGGSPRACAHVVLDLLNADRAKNHRGPLHLKLVQSMGMASCPGSVGHSIAMAASGSTWHQNSHYPRASFPRNVCVPFHHAAENLGMAFTGDTMTDLRVMDQLMMSEPHSASICRYSVNHACNELDPAFRQVGIGVESINGSTWLTEDFLG